jgi:large subunit ribosomal protein L9
MKVILKEILADLGKIGDTVNVADGYARNYLIPRQLAVQATPQNIKLFEQGAAKRAKVLELHKASQQQIADALNSTPITIIVKTGEDDRLFGSVTAADIADALKVKGVEIDKKKIALAAPIRALGIYSVPIKLHPDIPVSLQLTVSKEEAPAPATEG